MSVARSEERLLGRDGPVPVRVFRPARPRGCVIVDMDAFGWRPELDGICARYAAQGYATFLPDLYHRLGKVRFAPPASADEPLDPAMHRANDATTIAMTLADTGAILDYAGRDAQLRSLAFGVVGYCMGARHALAALATFPDRIKAAACLHGGRMVWDGESSPHLYIPRLKGHAYFAFAADDPTCPAEHQALIEATIAASGAPATTERFAAAHGWTFPERHCHDPAAAERVWAKVLTLFATHVAAVAAGPSD
jgi:carboxymethylenebutenolidase